MIQARCSMGRCGATAALPCIQPNVMVIPARRKKRGGVTKSLRDLETEDPMVKIECSIEIRHLEMNMAQPYARINRCSGATNGFTHSYWMNDRLKSILWMLVLPMETGEKENPVEKTFASGSFL